MREATDDQLVEHTRAIAEVIPVFGFYLQPSVGGRVLSFDFWRQISQIANVVAIKIAPFNRYRTIDVIRAVAESGRADEIALYTGNDDSIVLDLLSEYRFGQRGRARALRITGGLLGHWAVWTRKAVEQLSSVRQLLGSGEPIDTEWLTLNAQITDANAALFDPQHEFAGCIAGIHEVLRRQGLMQGRWCLNPREDLSEGQMEEIDRVCASYPHLSDDSFVREHLHEWLS
jgi:dihydrodipicolinate synthase/N-acetylneuraminate lyase